MIKERRRAIRFRRASFLTPSAGIAPATETLESYLRRAHRVRKTVADRRVIFEGGYVLEVRLARARRAGGTYIHLAAYTEKEPASVVPKPRGEEDEAPLSTVAPPNGAEYMDGDLLMLVAGNDVILCSNSLHESRLEAYCASIFNAVELPPAAAMFKLGAVANVDMVEVLEKEGVKSISMDATAFSASLERASRQSIRRTVSDGVRDMMQSLFGEDESLKDIYDKENLSAEVVFKFDRRRKGGEVGQDRISTFAKKLLDEPTDGFAIKTFRNTTVRHGDIVLQKVVTLPANGKTVDRERAFHEISTYYAELIDSGQLEE